MPVQFLISTGSRSLDEVMAGGVHSGFITDFFGSAGSGKSQLCFSLCANCVRQGGKVLFVDTMGTFRPERVAEIAGTESVLSEITVARATSSSGNFDLQSYVRQIYPALIIIDSLSALFSEGTAIQRHLNLMRMLHNLATIAINGVCHAVVTNDVRAILSEIDSGQLNRSRGSQTREYLGSSVSIYSHFKYKLQVVDPAQSLFQAARVQPPGKAVLFLIQKTGVKDVPQ